MTNENQPAGSCQKPTPTDPAVGAARLAEILKTLRTNQVRFCVARLDVATDKEAAALIGLTPAGVKAWDNKADVDEAVSLMRYDGMITALELRRRALAEAMAVKTSGLRSDKEQIRQAAATEIIEWEMGKAVQKNEISGRDGTDLHIVVKLTDETDAAN
jgi:hypothetical protein